jgi:uncharacterized surface protein with fasciclin (FAS1) repeats
MDNPQFNNWLIIKYKERLEMRKKATLYALLIAAMMLVGLCLAASDTMDASAEDTAEDTAEMAAEMDIVDTAIAAEDFTTLVSAIQSAELVETLKGPGPFTVFAPTDEAFAKISPEELAALLENKTELIAVLTYHVVSGEVMSADLSDEMIVPTIQGENLTITTTDGVMVNDAMVVQADIVCSNGVIHAIDTVLMP